MAAEIEMGAQLMASASRRPPLPTARGAPEECALCGYVPGARPHGLDAGEEGLRQAVAARLT